MVSFGSNVENDKGELAQDDQQRKIIWENYISNPWSAVENVDDKDLSGPPITKECCQNFTSSSVQYHRLSHILKFICR